MTVTSADILKIRDELARDPKLTAAEVVQGTRTLVHKLLMDESPMPHLMADPDEGKTDYDFQKAAEDAMSIRDATERLAALGRIHDDHVQHRAERMVRAKNNVTIGDQVRFEAERANGKLPITVQDAHHFVQYEHGKSIWEATDKLVAAAGVK